MFWLMSLFYSVHNVSAAYTQSFHHSNFLLTKNYFLNPAIS